MDLAVAWESTETGNGHQTAISALQLVRIVDIPEPIVFGASKLSTGGLTLSWTDGTVPYRLQYRSAINGAWTELAAVTSGTYTATDLGAAGFYRIVDALGN